MKKHASRCLLVKRCANSNAQHSMPDSPRQKYAKSSLFALSEIQKFPGKYEEILFFRLPARCVNGTFARQWSRFTMKMNCCSRHAEFTLSYVAETFRNASGNDRLAIVLPFKQGTLRVTMEDRFPEGILLTTHDHALLTKNFCALAPEYKGTLSHLEERAQRAHYRTCYAWHARTCADRRARRVFLL